MKYIFSVLILLILLTMAVGCGNAQTPKLKISNQLEGNAVKHDGNGNMIFYVGDACFWCTEGIWDEVPGVIDVKSGYLGGDNPKNPTYQNHGNYAEGNKITYDPSVISFKELVDYYFLVHSFGKSPDKGKSYRAVIWSRKGDVSYVSKAYAKAARTHGFFQQQVIVDEINWFDAEDYHQDYVKRLEAGESVANPGYGRGESIPRRNRALKKINKYNQTKKLTDEQAYILLKGGTERAFSSPLNSEKRDGYFVSPATGDTLFHSSSKFDSGTGWPSFDAATDKVVLGQKEQGGWEVLEKSTGYHLGHLFKGELFTRKDKRFCINGDALVFMPKIK